MCALWNRLEKKLVPDEPTVEPLCFWEQLPMIWWLKMKIFRGKVRTKWRDWNDTDLWVMGVLGRKVTQRTLGNWKVQREENKNSVRREWDGDLSRRRRRMVTLLKLNTLYIRTRESAQDEEMQRWVWSGSTEREVGRDESGTIATPTEKKRRCMTKCMAEYFTHFCASRKKGHRSSKRQGNTCFWKGQWTGKSRWVRTFATFQNGIEDVRRGKNEAGRVVREGFRVGVYSRSVL